jgi:hypothetical protein
MSVTVEKTTLSVNGLRVQVFARPGLRESSDPVTILIALHGRTESAEALEPTARTIFQWIEDKHSGEKQRELVVVTFVSKYFCCGKFFLSRTERIHCDHLMLLGSA